MSFTNIHHQVSPILPNIDGWILLLDAENASAIIWMYRLSHIRESHIMNICQLFYHIVFYFKTIFPSRFDGQHIAESSIRITLHTRKYSSVTRRWHPFQPIAYH